MTNPFDDVSLDQLRRRRSEKWATYPPDVLPSFYAEMDFAPAPAINRALHEAVESATSATPTPAG